MFKPKKPKKKGFRVMCENGMFETFNVSNVTFLDPDTLHKYVEANKLDLGCDVVMKLIRFGRAKDTVNVRPSAA